MASSAQDVRLPGGSKLDARTVLRLNGIASVGAGALMLVLAGPFAHLGKVGRPGILAILGALLLAYGFDELGLAVGRRLRRMQVRLFAVADAAWVIGGAVFLGAGPAALSFLERAVIVVVAALFGWFAFAGFRAAREL